MGSYVITGATGFVGSYLAHRLVEEGQDVHALVRRGSRVSHLCEMGPQLYLHEVDLLDSIKLTDELQAINADWIWHLATYGGLPSQRDTLKIGQTNYMGTVNLLAAACKVGFKGFINTGSSSEYGIKMHPMREDDLLVPLSPYGASKAAAALHVQAIGQLEQLPAYTLRLFSPYGPFEQETRLIPTVILGYLRGEAPRLSSPSSVRDFLFVEDVYRLYRQIEASSLQPGAILNVGSGVQHTVADVVDTVKDLVGSDLTPIWGSMKSRHNEPTCWVADMGKTKHILDWRPTFDLRAGLSSTLDWFKERQGDKVSSMARRV